MSQIQLHTNSLDWVNKRIRKRDFLAEMERVVPWTTLVGLIGPHSPHAKTGRPPFATETMLRIHFVQNWFSFSDMAMKEALIDTPLYRELVRLNVDADRSPDAVAILRFRHLLEAQDIGTKMLTTVNDLLSAKGLMLKTGTAVNATLIPAPSSTRNGTGERDPEIQSTQKSGNWYFGIKAHVRPAESHRFLFHEVGYR